MSNKKKNRIIKNLYTMISYDPIGSNPNWKWEWLPDEIKENYHLVRNKLIEWDEAGYIELIENEEVWFKLLSIPPLK